MALDIMMPFYGRFDHFRLAVESVLAQENADWRLVIVDDVYPDPAPGEWARALDDPRVHYVRNPINLGTSANYRKCVELMTSEFGILMGCDDVMHPQFVGHVLDLVAQFPNVDIIQPGVEVINARGVRSTPLADRVKSLYRPSGSGPRRIQGERLATSLLRGNWTYFPSLVWRVSTIRRLGFRLDLPVVQDLAMLLEIAQEGGTLLADDRIVFRYRRHAASVSASTGVDGSKFAQERILFRESQRALWSRGWRSGVCAAQGHLSSRLNALTELPRSILSGDRRGRSALWSHIVGWDRTDRGVSSGQQEGES